MVLTPIHNKNIRLERTPIIVVRNLRASKTFRKRLSSPSLIETWRLILSFANRLNLAKKGGLTSTN
jgi:hypothetical protein